MMHRAILLLQFLLVQTQNIPSFQVVGIFSSCTEEKNTNQTQLIKDASFLQDMYEKGLPAISNFGYRDLIRYYDFEFNHFFDVCGNETKLAEVVGTLLLSQRYNNFQIGSKPYNYSSIFVIFTQMPENMVSLLYSAVGDIPVLFVKSFSQDPVQSWANDLTIMADHFGIKELTLIAIKSTEDYPYMTYYRKSVETFQSLEFCIMARMVDPSRDLVKQISSFIDFSDSMNLKPVILFGNTIDQIDLLQAVYDTYSRMPFIPIVHDLELVGFHEKYPFLDKFMVLSISRPARFQDPYFLLKIQSAIDQFNEMEDYLKFTTILNLSGYENFLYELSNLHRHNHHHPDYKYYYQHRKYNEPVYVMKDSLINTLGLHAPKLTPVAYPNSIVHNFTLLENTKPCKHPVCGPGFHEIYGNVMDGFSWKCVLCPENTVKPLSGNGTCEKCTGRFNIDDGKRTSCIDPFTNIHVGFNDSEFVILVGLSSSGLILTILIGLVFVIKRKTPMVSVSDFIFSLIHMSIMGLLFVIIPSTFFGIPDFPKCISRLLSVSLLYATNVGIVFIKSQKLLLAFLSKVRITAEDVKRTKIMQMFTIVMFLFFINSLLGIATFQKPLESTEHLNYDTMISFHYCNNYTHCNVLIASIMIIQLMCSIQAFRGRNLPSVMNDGIVLMYTTFILTIVFGVSFVIVNAQSPQMKELFQCIVVTINNMVILFLLYGQKAIRMLVYPQMNTSEYFQQVRMYERRQDVNQAIERR